MFLIESYMALPWWAKLIIGLLSMGSVWVLVGSFKVMVQVTVFFLSILLVLTGIFGVGDGLVEGALVGWRKMADKLASDEGFMNDLKAKAKKA